MCTTRALPPPPALPDHARRARYWGFLGRVVRRPPWSSRAEASFPLQLSPSPAALVRPVRYVGIGPTPQVGDEPNGDHDQPASHANGPVAPARPIFHLHLLPDGTSARTRTTESLSRMDVSAILNPHDVSRSAAPSLHRDHDVDLSAYFVVPLPCNIGRTVSEVRKYRTELSVGGNQVRFHGLKHARKVAEKSSDARPRP